MAGLGPYSLVVSSDDLAHVDPLQESQVASGHGSSGDWECTRKTVYSTR